MLVLVSEWCLEIAHKIMLKLRLQKNKKTQSGFTILVAVVTAGILLIIAMSIGGIALKEQVLASANKESQVAFYAADTGLECAMYWDQIMGKFAPTVDDASGKIKTQNTVVSGVNCNGFSVSPSSIGPDVSGTVSSQYSYKFEVNKIDVGDGGVLKTCAVVEVDKDTNAPDPAGGVRTSTDIYSHGYNTCDPSLLRLERGVEAHY